jgi:hypothetical protein
MSTVILDTITGKSTATTITIGSTPVVSASANSMTIRGEGSAQTSIQQGLAKAWTFTTDNAVNNSFNTSALTDNGTGDYSFTITSAMSNGDFSVTSNVAENVVLILFNIARTTSAYRIGLAYIDASATRYDKNSSTVIHGDLA